MAGRWCIRAWLDIARVKDVVFSRRKIPKQFHTKPYAPARRQLKLTPTPKERKKICFPIPGRLVHSRTRYTRPFSSIRTVTVGSGITPDLLTLHGRRSRAGDARMARPHHRRWGLAPRPENTANIRPAWAHGKTAAGAKRGRRSPAHASKTRASYQNKRAPGARQLPPGKPALAQRFSR